MKVDLVRKYLAPSPATSTGRMKRPCMGIQSTRKADKDSPDVETPKQPVMEPMKHIVPVEQIDDLACNVFCFAHWQTNTQVQCTQMRQEHYLL